MHFLLAHGYVRIIRSLSLFGHVLWIALLIFVLVLAVCWKRNLLFSEMEEKARRIKLTERLLKLLQELLPWRVHIHLLLCINRKLGEEIRWHEGLLNCLNGGCG